MCVTLMSPPTPLMMYFLTGLHTLISLLSLQKTVFVQPLSMYTLLLESICFSATALYAALEPLNVIRVMSAAAWPWNAQVICVTMLSGSSVPM